MNLRGRAVPSLLLLSVLFLLVACFVTGLTGPTTVTIGQTATYDVAFATDSAGANGTAYVFMDVPIGWTVTAAAYDATVNGASTSGNATTGVIQSGTPCVAATGPAPGYQRLGFSASFPTVTANDSGTLHVTFTIGGATGGYTLAAFGGGSFGGPTQQCNQLQTATLDVTVNAVAALTPPTVAKAFSPASIEPGEISRLTITLSNANGAALTGAAFTDTYPGGLVNATPANAATTCGGTVSSTTNTVTLSGGTIPANGSCTVSIDVTAASNGSLVNTIAAGDVTTTNGGANTSASNSATLQVSTAGPAAAETIPTASEYALMALAAMLALFAVARIRA
jgi:uncharacterized repeat protein (TIGR01451 family)